jgi:hypothetical protein
LAGRKEERDMGKKHQPTRSTRCAVCGEEILLQNVYEDPEEGVAPLRVIGPDGQLLAVVHRQCAEDYAP